MRAYHAIQGIISQTLLLAQPARPYLSALVVVKPLKLAYHAIPDITSLVPHLVCNVRP
jgi:hypothetical protein